MKNKKGFTLIELLAVIVILAIIALIAVPIILNMINEARKSAAKSSALGYVDSIEAYTGFRQLSEDTELDGYDVDLPTMTNGKVTCTKTSSGWNSECSAFFEAVDKKNKGKSPDTATIIISEDGKVQNGTKMKYNGYEVNYDGKDATVGGNSGSNTPVGGYTSASNFETDGNDNIISWTELNSEWNVYLHNTGSSIETCSVYPSGTVCLTNSSTGYGSDFEDVTSTTEGITTIPALKATGLKGYSLAKAEEMLTKGASSCDIGSDFITCYLPTFGFCDISYYGEVRCIDIDSRCDVYYSGIASCD